MTQKPMPTRPARPPREGFPEDIETVLSSYGHRARVVVLYRQLEGQPRVWTYLGRLRPSVVTLDTIGQRFGHGWYRGKIMGGWNRETRREEYLDLVTFGLAEQGWPMTAETRRRIREQHGI